MKTTTVFGLALCAPIVSAFPRAMYELADELVTRQAVNHPQGGAAQQAAANPLCFAIAFAKVELPRITGLNAAALAPLNTILNTLTTGQNCAAIGSVNETVFAACPGASLYGGPTGPVAPGAIQGYALFNRIERTLNGRLT